MTILLVGISGVIYHSMSAALLDEMDAGLRFRAAALLTVPRGGAVRAPDQPRLEEPGEAFAQLLTRDGRVLSATGGFTTPLLRPAELVLTQPTFFDRPVRRVVGTARLLALPVTAAPASTVLVVGTTMADRSDALHALAQVVLIGGSTAITLACFAAWLVAGLALRPMERMRQQTAAITASRLDRRLAIPAARDQMRGLAETLNDMLERLDGSFRHERQFLQRASHELRTPLAALRAELDLTLSRPRTAAELTATLHSASEETDRLARLADDLLVLARVGDGVLPLHRQDMSLRDSLESAAALFSARALDHHITLTVEAAQATLRADPVRLRQALVNLLDNALRHTPRGGSVTLLAVSAGSDVTIAVADTGPGFLAADADPDRYSSSRDGRPDAQGLGLRITHAITTSHRGTLRIGRNSAGGALVEMDLPNAVSTHDVAGRGSTGVTAHRRQAAP